MFSLAMLIDNRNRRGEIGGGDSMEMKKGEQAAQLGHSFTADSWADRAIIHEIVFMEKMVVVAFGNVAGELIDEKNSMKGGPGKEVGELSLVGGDSLGWMTG
jgi:hypothetical protein